MATYPVHLDAQARKIFDALSNPEAIAAIVEQIDNYADIADALLPKKWGTRNGVVAIPKGKAKPDSSKVEVIPPGGAYPLADVTSREMIYKAIQRLGMASVITIEALEQNAWLSVDEAMNEVVFAVGERRNLLVIDEYVAAKGDMHQVPSGVAWNAIKDGKPVEALITAIAKIKGVRRGFKPDTLILPSLKEIQFASSDEVMKRLTYHVGRDQAVWDGANLILGGTTLKVVSVPDELKLVDPIVVDSTRVGGQAFKLPGDEPSDEDMRRAMAGINVSAKYYGSTEVTPSGHTNAWYLAGDDRTNPFINNPLAAAVITGTA